jgi:DNA polymerase-3 subunit delta
VTALKSADVERFLAKPDPAKPVVLIFGADAGLIRERAEKIIRASVDNPHDPFSLVRLEGEALGEAGRLVDEANTIPLFGGRRAIWVKAGGRNIAPAVEPLLESPPKDCRVVIEAGDLRRSAPLRNLCERSKSAAAIACYPDTEKEIARLIEEEMRAANLSIAPDARDALMPLLGGDRAASRNELRKLALYAHGQGEVGIDDVAAVVSEASALQLDGVVDAMFAGKIGDAEREFSKVIAAGMRPDAIIFPLMRQLSWLHKMRLAIEQGRSVTQVVESAQPPIHFRRKSLIEAALRAWTAERLVQAMAQIAEAAFEVRRQASLGEVIAQRTVLSVASAARRRE